MTQKKKEKTWLQGQWCQPQAKAKGHLGLALVASFTVDFVAQTGG